MKILLAVLIVLILLTFVPSAHALGPDNHNVQKINTHVIEKTGKSCHNWTENGWIVELKHYKIYQDYLDDLKHYYSQYPRTCKITPEVQ